MNGWLSTRHRRYTSGVTVKRNMMNYRFIIVAFCAFFLLLPDYGRAEKRQYCVICNGPDQTYQCQVNTPTNSSGDKGLQLFCIISVSKEGGHKSCAVRDDTSAVCAGPVKTYTFQAPAISPQLRSAVDNIRKSRGEVRIDQAVSPKQKNGAPETMIDMTGRALKASRQGLKKSGQAVGGAASSTKQKVGQAARGAGKGVTKTAKKVGSATKKTGSAVGNAAKTAYNCLKSWFKECSSKSEEAPSVSQ